MRSNGVMRSTYAFLVRHRYRFLAILSFLLVAEVIQPLLGIVSFEHERFVVWMSFPTLLAWIGVATLIGAVSPINDGTIKYAYFMLVVIPLVMFVNLGLFVSGIYWPTIWNNGLSLLVYITVVVLTGAVASSNQKTRAHSVLVYFPLIMASWAGLLTVGSLAVPTVAASSILYSLLTPGLVLVLSGVATSLMLVAFAFQRIPHDKPRTASMYIVIALIALSISTFPYLMLIVLIGVFILLVPFILPYLAAIVVAAAGTAFVHTIRSSARRNVTVVIVALWAMIAVLGAYWGWTVDRGLDAFSGEERLAAEQWSRHAGFTTPCSYGPAELRISKDDRGYFQGRVYTFWRLPGNPCS